MILLVIVVGCCLVKVMGWILIVLLVVMVMLNGFLIVDRILVSWCVSVLIILFMNGVLVCCLLSVWLVVRIFVCCLNC